MKDYSKTIETERLILRKFKLSDAEDMFKNYCGREKVTEFVSFDTYKSVHDAVEYLTNKVLPEYDEEHKYRWAIELKETHEVIGSIDCVGKTHIERKCAEIGYVLGDQFWGKCIMPEAGKAVIAYLFDEGYVRIEAVHDINNPKSGRVMQKIGMVHEGTMKKARCHKKCGELTFIDCELYAIINPKFV